jgi:hypothetical protein
MNKKCLLEKMARPTKNNSERLAAAGSKFVFRRYNCEHYGGAMPGLAGMLIALFLCLASRPGQAQESMQGIPQFKNGSWLVRFNQPAAQDLFQVSPSGNGVRFEIKDNTADTAEAYVFGHLTLSQPIQELTFDYKANGDATRMPITLYDAAANVLWQYDGKGQAPGKVKLRNLKVRGQLVFKVKRLRSAPLAAGWYHAIQNLRLAADRQKPTLTPDGFTLIDKIDELRGYAGESNVKIKLKPGTYRIDNALFRYFMEFTGSNTHWDLKGVKLQVDTRLFRQFGVAPNGGEALIYCVLGLSGTNMTMEGLEVETFGHQPGIASRNKIFNITGTGIILRHVDVRTEGSSPWGYGSLYGISGGDVRKMNGIRVGWPAKDVLLISCRVHMRAMGHAIFVQGAENTMIEDCHVDGLLRTTNEILAEKSGYAFDKKFIARNKGYVEGVIVGEDGRILPGEMVSLSEDGIRIYPQTSAGKITGATIIKDCTVTNMRRGICTGLNAIGDRVINCKVTNAVASGFNVGANDTLINCRADAKYAEALSLAYVQAQNASVDLEILDSRNGMANSMLAKINGQHHQVTLHTANPAFIPQNMTIELATKNGYGGPRNGSARARGIQLANHTPARVIFFPGTESPLIKSIGKVDDRTSLNGK